MDISPESATIRSICGHVLATFWSTLAVSPYLGQNVAVSQETATFWSNHEIVAEKVGPYTCLMFNG